MTNLRTTYLNGATGRTLLVCLAGILIAGLFMVAFIISQPLGASSGRLGTEQVVSRRANQPGFIFRDEEAVIEYVRAKGEVTDDFMKVTAMRGCGYLKRDYFSIDLEKLKNANGYVFVNGLGKFDDCYGWVPLSHIQRQR